MVLDRLLRTGDQAQGRLDDFGVELGVDNVDDVIARLRSRQQDYRQRNAGEIMELNAWVQDFERTYLAQDGD